MLHRLQLQPRNIHFMWYRLFEDPYLGKLCKIDSMNKTISPQVERAPPYCLLRAIPYDASLLDGNRPLRASAEQRCHSLPSKVASMTVTQLGQAPKLVSSSSSERIADGLALDDLNHTQPPQSMTQDPRKKPLSSLLRLPYEWTKGPEPPRVHQINPILPKLQTTPLRLFDSFARHTILKRALLALASFLWLCLFIYTVNGNETPPKIPGFGAPKRLSCAISLWYAPRAFVACRGLGS